MVVIEFNYGKIWLIWAIVEFILGRFWLLWVLQAYWYIRNTVDASGMSFHYNLSIHMFRLPIFLTSYAIWLVTMTDE